MADYSRDDAQYATNIVERLMNREGEGLDLGEDIVISDVESDANAFSEDLSLLQDFKTDMPAMLVGDEKVPISLELVFGSSVQGPSAWRFGARPWRHHPYFYELARELLRPLRENREFDGFTSMNRDEARTTFIRRATDFVATRISAIREFRSSDASRAWPGVSLLNIRQRVTGARVTTPGCQFTISTNSNGLRVFWSGAYRISPNNFNHPTSPTSSILQSGTYVFGVDGGAYGNNIQWDPNCVVSLPGQPYAHLNF